MIEPLDFSGLVFGADFYLQRNCRAKPFIGQLAKGSKGFMHFQTC